MDFSCLVYWSKLTLFATTCIMQMEVCDTETMTMYNINRLLCFHFDISFVSFQLVKLPPPLLLKCLNFFACIELSSPFGLFFNWSLIHHWFMLWNISNILMKYIKHIQQLDCSSNPSRTPRAPSLRLLPPIKSGLLAIYRFSSASSSLSQLTQRGNIHLSKGW